MSIPGQTSLTELAAEIRRVDAERKRYRVGSDKELELFWQCRDLLDEYYRRRRDV
jgi:hypothetical protein